MINRKTPERSGVGSTSKAAVALAILLCVLTNCSPQDIQQSLSPAPVIQTAPVSPTLVEPTFTPFPSPEPSITIALPTATSTKPLEFTPTLPPDVYLSAPKDLSGLVSPKTNPDSLNAQWHGMMQYVSGWANYNNIHVSVGAITFGDFGQGTVPMALANVDKTGVDTRRGVLGSNSVGDQLLVRPHAQGDLLNIPTIIQSLIRQPGATWKNDQGVFTQFSSNGTRLAYVDQNTGQVKLVAAPKPENTPVPINSGEYFVDLNQLPSNLKSARETGLFTPWTDPSPSERYGTAFPPGTPVKWWGIFTSMGSVDGAKQVLNLTTQKVCNAKGTVCYNGGETLSLPLSAVRIIRYNFRSNTFVDIPSTSVPPGGRVDVWFDWDTGKLITIKYVDFNS